jgi:hypothetical protein
MTVREIVDLYYEGWTTKRGDLSAVPLADNFLFQSPVARIEGADAYRAMALEAGQAITRFDVRHKFIDGDLACVILDWQMVPLTASLAAAELLSIEAGGIVRSELIYDAQDLRTATQQSAK